MRFMRRYQMPKKITIGKTQENRSRRNVLSTSPLKVTWYLSRSSERSWSTRLVRKGCVSPGFPSTFIFPSMRLAEMATSVTFPSFSIFRNWL
ncbi:MAG: hypothetical protein BWX71_02845 [Deltaproteobacteria bacterium ADurb.Bin072]|nr:MAG: hypothetical protein BWX71_02845 [Deltaproteobacteria bacterium ADurb.Bin072]